MGNVLHECCRCVLKLHTTIVSLCIHQVVTIRVYLVLFLSKFESEFLLLHAIRERKW